MNVSRRQFGSAMAGLFGGLVLFRGASAATGSPAAKMPEGRQYRQRWVDEKSSVGGYVMRGTVASTPRLKHYWKSDGSSGYRMFFRFAAGVTEPTSCVVWGRLAYDLHHKAQIREGMPLLVAGTPMAEKDPDGNDWVHVVLNRVVLDEGEQHETVMDT